MSTVTQNLYCETHPDRATSLRCNRCDKLICAKCAVRTPIGYRCKQCVSNQQKVFDSTIWTDYVLAFFISGVLSFFGSLLTVLLPMGILTFIVAPLVGTAIGESVRLATRKRRSKQLNIVVVSSVILGASPYIFIGLISLIFGTGFMRLFSLIWQGVYLFMAASSAYYRVSGTTLRLK